MTTDEREDRALTRYVWGLALIMAVAVGMVIGNVFPANLNAEPKPDWAVADCAEWADTSAPVLPAYTRTDVCAAQTESGAWVMSSPTNPSPALDAPVTH